MQLQCKKNDWIGMLRKHHLWFFAFIKTEWKRRIHKLFKVSSLKYKAIPNCTMYFTFLAFCWKLSAMVESGNIATYSSESESAALKDTLKSIISRYHTISVWITWSSVLNCLDDIAELVNERAPLLKTNFDRCEADLAESICFNLFYVAAIVLDQLIHWYQSDILHNTQSLQTSLMV